MAGRPIGCQWDGLAAHLATKYTVTWSPPLNVGHPDAYVSPDTGSGA
jgi:hypothetical protein